MKKLLELQKKSKKGAANQESIELKLQKYQKENDETYILHE